MIEAHRDGIVTACSVVANGREFDDAVARLREPALEVVERLLGTGLRVTHLNGHQHLQMLPRVRRIVKRLADEYRMGYIRRDAMLSILGDCSRRMIGVAEAAHLTTERILALLDHVDEKLASRNIELTVPSRVS